MLRKVEREEFDQVFSIMEESFPLTEYRPYAEQEILLSRSDYVVYAPTGEELRAFMATYEFKEFLFIEHLAVRASCRNQGLGAKLLQALAKETEKRLCLEVEPPNTELAARRIAFYERNGFTLNKYPYIQPSISKGREPIPLYIMTSQGGITREEFEKIKGILYKSVYGQG